MNRLDVRRLMKAEITLGELGWQQADFPDSVEETINNLRRIENEQAELFNRSADLAGELSAAQKERDEHRATYEKVRRGIVAETQPHLTEKQQHEEARAELHQLTAALRGQLPELQGQEREYRRQIEEIPARGLPLDEAQDERKRLTDLHQATLSSLTAASEGIEKSCATIRTHDEAIARVEPIIEAFEKKLDALDGAFNAADHERAEAILKLQQDKHGVERRLAELDKAKGNEFLIVGRCLADANIPPMNQPQALEKVLALRETIANRLRAIAESLAWSDAADHNELRKFYFAVGMAMGLVVLVVCVSLRASGH